MAGSRILKLFCPHCPEDCRPLFVWSLGFWCIHDVVGVPGGRVSQVGLEPSCPGLMCRPRAHGAEVTGNGVVNVRLLSGERTAKHKEPSD